VLFDAVAVVPSAAGATLLSTEKTALDWVNDAYAHCKFVAFNAASAPLMARALGGTVPVDEGMVPLRAGADADKFITLCRQIRLWAREPKVKKV
jgi:catalase